MLMRSTNWLRDFGTRYLLLFMTLPGLSVCSNDEQQPKVSHPTPTTTLAVKRLPIAAEQLQHGHDLFLTHCASCHGQRAEGAANWQQRDASGAFPPPPLNGTGHAWHHPQRVLEDTIKNGTVRLGGKMPAWKEKLSDQQIRTILLWLQSQWPDELYAAWYRMNQEALQSH
jgi:mono/diheme cytochrome c family protein